MIYRRALEVAPQDSLVLSTAAHFLSEESGDLNEAQELFKKALYIEPDNSLHAMWYAKLLKKRAKYGEAELMYNVALKSSIGDLKLEATCMCNYATFMFKHRKNISIANEVFTEGLKKYPGHKGLLKNYKYLLKSNPSVQSDSNLLNKANSSSNSLSNRSITRIDSAIRAELSSSGSLGNRINSDSNPDYSNYFPSSPGKKGNTLISPKKNSSSMYSFSSMLKQVEEEKNSTDKPILDDDNNNNNIEIELSRKKSLNFNKLEEERNKNVDLIKELVENNDNVAKLLKTKSVSLIY